MKKKLTILCFVVVLALVGWTARVIVTSMKIDTNIAAARFLNKGGFCQVEAFHDRPFTLIVSDNQETHHFKSHLNFSTLKYEALAPTNSIYKDNQDTEWCQKDRGIEYQVGWLQDGITFRVVPDDK